MARGKMGIGGRGGWPRSRDLQTTNPNAPENYLATLRSVPLYTKFLLHKLGVVRVASATSEGQGRAKMGLEVTAGGFDPVTSKQIPADLRISSPPREARPYFPNPCYMNGWFCEGGEPNTQERKMVKTARDTDDAAR